MERKTPASQKSYVNYSELLQLARFGVIFYNYQRVIIWRLLRLAWGATKFIFGLGLFWFCPLLFVLSVLFGGFSHTWLLIVIVGLLFGGGFRRI